MPKYFDGHLFNVGDVHHITGVAAAEGGTLSAHCLNGTVPDYTITLGNGTLGPWYNHSSTEPFIKYKAAKTSLTFQSKYPLFANVTLYYDLDAAGPFGAALTQLIFYINDGDFAEQLGDLRHLTH